MDLPRKDEPPAVPVLRRALTYEQDRDGRYLCADGRVLAIITGVTGLEAQRVGQGLAAGPGALDAIARCLPRLDAVQGALVLVEVPPIVRKLLYAAQCDLTSALVAAGREIPELYQWREAEATATAQAAD